MAVESEHPIGAVDIRPLLRDETATGAAVLGRGMRDNPIHVRVFGADPGRREAALTRLFTALLDRQVAKGQVLGAFSAGTLVGVCSMAPPHRCRLSGAEKLKMVPVLVTAGGPRSALRTLNWSSHWARRDPNAPHWHLGPVGVERPLQGMGIGGMLLRTFCGRVDSERAAAYLETDKRENVGIYEHFGFRTIAEEQVLGIPNWFMLREAGAR